MMTLQMLSLFQVIVILCTTSFAYPVYGTKRYNGRSVTARTLNNNFSWGSSLQPYQQFVRSQRFPINYYEMYPYNRDYQDDYYYPQESMSYPVYIPPPRTSKYEVYQAVLPYYYGEGPVPRQNYGYYGYDKHLEPVEDMEEEMLQEAEREEREDAQPIGQEVLYENEDTSNDNLDDVNAAFLQNLIISQMYKDANNKQRDLYDQYPSSSDYYFDDDNYGRWDKPTTKSKQLFSDDKDVLELKQLANTQKQEDYNSEKRPTAGERLHSIRNSDYKKLNKNKNYNYDNKRNSLGADKKDKLGDHGTVVYGMNDLTFNNRKPLIIKSNAAISSTAMPTLTTISNKKDIRKGQKEEVLMRPATPVRHPFASPVLQLMKNEPERKREPSVYDTIKHMLDMEKSLENNNYRSDELRAPMRKRIISSEDSLTHQLSVLKKAQ